MLADVVPYLTCPHCGADLTMDTSLRCPNRHTFDVARQGYVSLLRGTATFTGDTAAMVAARADFLGAGHYTPVVNALAAAAPPADVVVDVGAGVGHYLAALLGEEAVGLALDASKAALRKAARAHPRIGAVVCDAWQPLPVRTASADLVLNVFAPRNPPELRRVLRPGGTLLVAAPTGRHLNELVNVLGLLTVETDKQSRIDERLAPHFQVASRTPVDFTMELTHEDVRALVGMGPSAFHAADDIGSLVDALPARTRVSGSVVVSAYR